MRRLQTTSSHWRQPAVLAIGLACFIAMGSARITPAATALGNSGELYELVPARAGNNAALGLRISRSGEAERLIMVPGTDDAGVEVWQSLTFEDDGGSLYVVWLSRIDDSQTVLKIAGLREGVWTEPLVVTSNTWSAKLAPQLVVTHERLRSAQDAWSERTILHVLWAEESSGKVETLYAPVILTPGASPAAPAVYRLNERARLKSWSAATDPSTALLRVPRLLKGRDGRTVVAAFVDAEGGRMVALEIDVMAQELSRAAEAAQTRLLAGGLSALGVRGSIERGLLASAVRTTVLDNQDLVREALEPLAQSLRELVLSEEAVGEEGLRALAVKARAHLIIGGARLRDRGLRAATAAETQSFATAFGAGGGAVDLRFAVARSLPAPSVGEGTVRLLCARDGSRFLVSWSDPAKVRYRISEGTAWSEIHQITLSPTLPLARVLAVLEEKVQAR